MERLIGTRLGKYELRRELGRGGMGAVYEGHDPLLQRRVAVKVLAPHLVWEPEFVERFFREARAAARLDHASIVAIYDVGEQDGWYYIVMKYLEGRPLAALIAQRGGVFSLAETLAILRPLAEALDYAHRQGLVHRDVKPANVIVGTGGQVTLTDFGIARAEEATRLTRTGLVIGTPEYIAPEQALGQPVDARADQYALGVIAYQMLCGRVPFEAESMPVLLHKVVYEPPPAPRALCPALPEGAAQALERVLAKEPGQRFASCVQFVETLEAAEAAHPRVRAQAVVAPPRAAANPAGASAVPADAARRGTHRGVPGRVRVLVALTALALFVLLLLGGWRLLSKIAAAGATLVTLPAPTASPATAPSPLPSSEYRPVPLEAALGDTWQRPSDGMVMVYVPAGDFEMGSMDGRPDEQPVHTVALDAFWMDRTEVTNAQYAQCVAAGACAPPSDDRSYGRSSYYGDADFANYPVVYVDWFQATAYCMWAGGQLPSEAQWEYAARGPEGYVFPWGNAFDGAHLNYCDDSCPFDWADRAGQDGSADTAPVASYPAGASWCGALDMAGNVWEWVADWYGKYPSGRQVNPTGPSSGAQRVLRGGGFDYLQAFVRAANRGLDSPSRHYYHTGFRCVMASPGS